MKIKQHSLTLYAPCVNNLRRMRKRSRQSFDLQLIRAGNFPGSRCLRVARLTRRCYSDTRRTTPIKLFLYDNLYTHYLRKVRNVGVHAHSVCVARRLSFRNQLLNIH